MRTPLCATSYLLTTKRIHQNGENDGYQDKEVCDTSRDFCHVNLLYSFHSLASRISNIRIGMMGLGHHFFFLCWYCTNFFLKAFKTGQINDMPAIHASRYFNFQKLPADVIDAVPHQEPFATFAFSHYVTYNEGYSSIAVCSFLVKISNQLPK